MQTIGVTRSKTAIRALWITTALAGGLALAAPAAAQQADDDDTIIVTAQFREQSVQDTPLAITAQTGEMLAARGINTTSELVAIAPNVNLTSNATVFGVSTSVFIRGVGQYDNNFAYEPGVGIYLDDIYYGVITGADFELADIDRVEILRGRRARFRARIPKADRSRSTAAARKATIRAMSKPRSAVSTGLTCAARSMSR